MVARRPTRASRSSRSANARSSRSASALSDGIGAIPGATASVIRKSDAPAAKWISVKRPPSAGIDFMVDTWVRVDQLTHQERLKYLPESIVAEEAQQSSQSQNAAASYQPDSALLQIAAAIASARPEAATGGQVTTSEALERSSETISASASGLSGNVNATTESHALQSQPISNQPLVPQTPAAIAAQPSAAIERAQEQLQQQANTTTSLASPTFEPPTKKARFEEPTDPMNEPPPPDATMPDASTVSSGADIGATSQQQPEATVEQAQATTAQEESTAQNVAADASVVAVVADAEAMPPSTTTVDHGRSSVAPTAESPTALDTSTRDTL